MRAAPQARGRLTSARLGAWMLGLLVLWAAVALLALLLGSHPVSLDGLLVSGSLDHTIVMGVRLPRVVMGLLVGGALGGAGATLQALLRNPLADPFVLGVSGGAALGATLAIVGASLLAAAAIPVADGAGQAAGAGWAGGWLGALPVSLSAAAGALLATLLMLFVSRAGGRVDTHAMLLGGVVFNAFAAAAILFLRTLVTPDEAHALLPWLVGSLAHRPWSHIAVGATLAGLGALFLTLRASFMNLLSVGDETAATLGVNVDRLRVELVVVVSLIVGATVSLAGLVGFVGLIVPHIIRLIAGPDLRLLLPASILGGGAFLVCCDLVSRLAFLPVGTEPPVGVVTALIGAPVFLMLLRKASGGGDGRR